MANTLNDRAWERFFAKSTALAEIAQRGFCYVSADELKEQGNREPRLMAKLDTLAERPRCFVENGINILPSQNGEYILFLDPGNRSYFSLQNLLEDAPVEEFTSAVDLPVFDTFPVNRVFSESQAIDFAFVSSLLKHFCQCEAMHLTVRGRLSSGSFELRLPSSAGIIDVSNVQIEVDAGYENTDQIILLEAKIGRRSDFHIRQVIYPYMQWAQKTKKKIRPIFLTYSNGQYVLTEFVLGDTYGALEVVSNRAFNVNDSEVAVVNLAEFLQTVELEGEPEAIPFPQANDIDKVVDTIQLIEYGIDTRGGVAEFFEFDQRQSYYYADAARYLGFIEKVGKCSRLTSTGDSFLTLSARTQRTRMILRQMLKRPVLRNAIILLAERQFDLNALKDSDLVAIIQRETHLSGSTPLRRASTLRKWFKWLLKNASFN